MVLIYYGQRLWLDPLKWCQHRRRSPIESITETETETTTTACCSSTQAATAMAGMKMKMNMLQEDHCLCRNHNQSPPPPTTTTPAAAAAAATATATATTRTRTRTITRAITTTTTITTRTTITARNKEQQTRNSKQHKCQRKCTCKHKHHSHHDDKDTGTSGWQCPPSRVFHSSELEHPRRSKASSADLADDLHLEAPLMAVPCVAIVGCGRSKPLFKIWKLWNLEVGEIYVSRLIFQHIDLLKGMAVNHTNRWRTSMEQVAFRHSSKVGNQPAFSLAVGCLWDWHQSSYSEILGNHPKPNCNFWNA